MNRGRILEQLTEIIREEFENEALSITEATTASDVDGWDSLSHLSLMHEVESSFNIKFTMAEIQGFKNVGELINAVEKRIK